VDTEAALERLFTTCPDVDLIEMTVHEPNPEGTGVLMIGSVNRKEFESCHPLSTATRLRLLGVNCLIVNGRIQRLPEAASASTMQEIFGLPGSVQSRDGKAAGLTTGGSDKLH